MNKVLSIISLFSAGWTWGLFWLMDALGLDDLDPSGGWIMAHSIHVIILIFNILTIRYCLKVYKEKQASKVPVVIAIIGTVLLVIEITCFVFLQIALYTDGAR